MKTAKFGGTSLADAARFRQVKRIVSADPELRFVVVSAPGKRSAEDKKVTDLLYDCHAAVKTGAVPETAFAPVAARFRQIAQELRLGIDLEAELRQIEKDLRSGASAAYCASRGEYLSGRMLAALLGWPFLDPAELHFFDADGVPQHKLAEQALMHRLHDMERAVMPGFYGGGADGRIHTLPRGGSDISGALLASASGSDAYENWTDVPGIFRADPAIVPSARAIPAMAYDEVRELAYMGANVLHEDAVTPARRMGIPIHIRSTMQPDAPGTLVSSQSPPSACPVTGIAGRKGYCSIQVEKENMNSAVGYCRRILSVLETHEIPFDHIATGLGSISFIAPAAAVSACREALLSDISAAVRPDSICVADGLAMVSIVGRDMAGRPGVSGRLLCALGRAGINVRMVVQGTREINITVGISEPEYEKAVHAVHGEFFPEAPQ